MLTPFVIKAVADSQEAPCAVCGQDTSCGPGLQLRQPDGTGPVCRDCGRRHAPELSALLELAEVAGRVGHIGRHARLWLPMESLLELARASEEYSAKMTVTTGRSPA